MITSTGTPVGAVKHVWLIILENKSYDETFTGLNQNSYLWQTLPQQGALLTNYYGTGHFSMDNYISLVSGQSPSWDVQDDCSTSANMTNNNSGIITNGTVGTGTDTDLTTSGPGTNTNAPTTSGSTNGNYGQLLVHGGVDADLGANGCVYPTDVTTLFNQFNAAGVSWKAYAQDLGGAQPTGSTSYVTGSTPGVSDTVPGRDDGQCGYPGMSSNNAVTNPTNLVAPSGDVTSFTGAQPANANNNGDPADQFVAKHFPTGVVRRPDRRVRRDAEQASPTRPSRPSTSRPRRSSTDRAPRRAGSDGLQLRRQPRGQPRRPHVRPGPRPEPPGATRSRRSTGSRRTTAATPTTPAARATTSPGRSTPTARRTTPRPACRPTTPRRRPRPTSRVGSTRPTSSCATTSR